MANIETQLLGSILVQHRIPHNLQSDDFKGHSNRVLFDYIKKIEAQDKAINLMSLFDALHSDHMEGIAGGPGVWASLTDHAPTGVDLDDFIKTAVDQLHKDQLIAHVSNLDRDPSEMEVNQIQNAIYQDVIQTDKDTQEVKYVKKLAADWYFIVADNDLDIKNCIAFDYTVGTPVLKYSDTKLLEAAIIHRLWFYVPVNKITDTVIKRIIGHVKLKNRYHNRVLEFVESLDRIYKDKISDHIMDEFLSVLTFQDEKDREHYKDIFYKFFLRMHLHIQGTRMIDGSFYGLMCNDIVPVLVGAQNLGKTTFAQWLACHHDEMYVDLGSGQVGSFGNQHTSKMCRGRMIVELGEMGIMRKSEDVEIVKSFISKDRYELDVKFVEYTNAIPSTCSFIGTSNPEQFLSDSTGNRRFYPIALSGINKELMAARRDIIERLHVYFHRLAKTIAREERFDRCTIKPETMLFIEGKRVDAMITYTDYGAIIEVVGKAYGDARDAGKSHHNVAAHDVEKWLGEAGYKLRVTKNGVHQALTAMGYEKKVISYHGVSVRGYRKMIQSSLQFVEEPPKDAPIQATSTFIPVSEDMEIY